MLASAIVLTLILVMYSVKLLQVAEYIKDSTTDTNMHSRLTQLYPM